MRRYEEKQTLHRQNTADVRLTAEGKLFNSSGFENPQTGACHYVILWRSWDWSLSPRECSLKNTCAESAAQSVVVVTLNSEHATRKL